MPPCGAALRVDDAVAAVEVKVPVTAVESSDAAVVVAIAMVTRAANSKCDQVYAAMLRITVLRLQPVSLWTA
jgi:hypothetical protein